MLAVRRLGAKHGGGGDAEAVLDCEFRGWRSSRCGETVARDRGRDDALAAADRRQGEGFLSLLMGFRDGGGVNDDDVVSSVVWLATGCG
ncbi:proline-rich receptor-like protein kinase PERK8 [Iris pallida]|uniref:Proline-rich receptor-like protein kinase PERK8 n=1 Tax=Iris pallida TaxID=29817 RepID=A0AAX6H081_IRIPA|nr:proline-rich receptor-like protein kinase PERK8 [Iris pallida]KAJ6834008.1 proline-rich receptor-like protein kinase PERK8 [Iris pallida]